MSTPAEIAWLRNRHHLKMVTDPAMFGEVALLDVQAAFFAMGGVMRDLVDKGLADEAFLSAFDAQFAEALALISSHDT